MPVSPRRRLWLAALVAVAALVTAVVALRRPGLPDTPRQLAADVDEPPLSAPLTSPFLNARPDVAYVGITVSPYAPQPNQFHRR